MAATGPLPTTQVLLMKPISKERFEAFIAYTRQPPAAGVFSSELEWYASDNEVLLATIILDLDGEFSTIILGRDADLKFRLINFPMIFEKIEEAREYMFSEAKKILEDKYIFPRADESNEKQDLFYSICDPKNINRHFEAVRTLKEYSSARDLIAEIMAHFKDIDGNFIEQFQSTGFDSRIWELYLFAYLSEERLFINREYEAPDFLVTDGRQKVAIEAVTVNASEGNKDIEDLTPEKIVELLKNDIPLKFGSALFSKMDRKNKKGKPIEKYWELEHVKGCSLVFAIADFSSEGSMCWSSNALIDYLYGTKRNWQVSDDGQLIIDSTEIDFTKHNGTKISGFFSSKDAENISAVLSSSAGTISKFVRMGKSAGFGDSSVSVKYGGVCHNHEGLLDPNKFFFEVDSNYKESWGAGISIFHNPNALHPLPKELFPSVAHFFPMENGVIGCLPPAFHPYTGLTFMHPVTENVTEEDFELLLTRFSTITGKTIKL
jgi:DNA-directed RNA polymerase subunit F